MELCHLSSKSLVTYFLSVPNDFTFGILEAENQPYCKYHGWHYLYAHYAAHFRYVCRGRMVDVLLILRSSRISADACDCSACVELGTVSFSSRSEDYGS